MHSKKIKSTLQSRGKSKKNEKLGKFLTTSNASRPDLSNLCKPIDTSISDLYQVSVLLEEGTDEVKSVLSYECNVIYECRTCYSLFRSIVNLISHKREYCKEKFDIHSLHKRIFNNCNAHAARESIIHMYKMEQSNETNNNQSIKNDRILRSQVSKETNKKDLAAIIASLNKKREECVEKQLENVVSNVSNDRNIYLEAIDTNKSAVYQTIESSNTVIDAMDLMKEQIIELQNMTDQKEKEQTAENQVEKSDSLIQAEISDEEDQSLISRLSTNNLSCSACNAKFSTKKTLTYHIKTLHTSKRLCYPCPCCTNTFANTWSVYRHLYKVHKKSSEQVRKLRSQIQEKAFHRTMDDTKNVCATKTSDWKKIVEDSNKTEEAPKHVDSGIKLCNKREKKSKRKASLPVHLQYHQMPVAACDETTLRIKLYNTQSFVTSNDIRDETEDADHRSATDTIIKQSVDEDMSSKSSKHTSSSPEISDHKTFIHVQDVSSFSKTECEVLENQDHRAYKSVDNNNSNAALSENSNSILLSPENQDDNSVPNKNMNSLDIIDAYETVPIISTNRKEKASSHLNERQLTDSKERLYKTEVENKIAAIADFRKLRCLLCRRKFTSLPNLRRHLATHIGWNRYRCKLCSYKCFAKCDCVAHCNKVHNMQNDCMEMVLKIQQNEYMCNEDHVADNSADLETRSDNVDINADANVQETRINFDESDVLEITRSETADVQVTTSCENVEQIADDRDKTDLQNLSDCMASRQNLDDNPELKRMVMEVIFGSDTTESESNSDKPAVETDNASDRVDAIDNINSAVLSNEPKETFCPVLNNVKQRPIRNRIKPLSKDFIYDFKEMTYRKESALINDSEIIHIRKKTKLCN